MTEIRLLSYNVRSLRDDTDALVRVIRSAQPDVVCLQEAPRLLRWRSRCAALARRSGLVVVGGGRAAGANIVLSSLAVEVVSVHEIGFSPVPGLHRRGMVLARLRRGGTPFAVCGTHLDTVDAPRLRHIAELNSAVGGLVAPGEPVIVAGDINAVPGSPSWSALAARRLDAGAVATVAASGHGGHGGHSDPDGHSGHGDPDGHSGPGSLERVPTFGSSQSRRCIDGVFVDPAIRVVSYSVLEGPDVAIASDHNPILVGLEIAG